MSQYAIYGAGAMGTILGAYLARAGEDILLVSRNREHVAALQQNGATVTGKEQFTQKVKAAVPAEMRGKFDVIFLMTKQRGNEQTAAMLKDYLKADGVICTLQNGLPELSVAQAVGEEKTYGCAVAWGATFRGAGVSELTSSEKSFALGGLKPKKEKIEEIRRLLSCMGEVTVEENLLGARFSKLTVNAAFSGLSAMTGETFGFVYTDKRANRAALAIINECFAVAKAAGITLRPIQGHDMEKVLTHGGAFQNAFASVALKIAMRHHKDLISGMLRDIRGGRKCDIDFINGTVCALGKQNGVVTPYNDKVVEIVHGIENGLYELTKENLLFFGEEI